MIKRLFWFSYATCTSANFPNPIDITLTWQLIGSTEPSKHMDSHFPDRTVRLKPKT